jgi:hypothetical protein
MLENFILNSAKPEDSLLYFYSSYAQILSAIFGVFGMFAVFRIERIDEKISKCCENFRNWCAFDSHRRVAILRMRGDSENQSWLEDDVKDHMDYLYKKSLTEESHLNKALSDYKNYYETYAQAKSTLSICLLILMALMSFCIVKSLYSLVYLQELIRLNRHYVLAEVYLLGILFMVIILGLGGYTYYCLFYPKRKPINTPLTNPRR